MMLMGNVFGFIFCLTLLACIAAHTCGFSSSKTTSPCDRRCVEGGELVVETPSGKLKGLALGTWTGTCFHSFRGVPFAEPPVGNLRFKAPVPVKAWQGIRDATKDGPICSQPFAKEFGSSDEDCLHLNVYTQKVKGNRPVIVYFHPGGWFSMTAISDWVGPQYLLDQNIVLVTVNYRLDVLGYLSTEDEHATGNYGMKDQVMALRWVRSHISKFGGDPNNVTIAGYSAGSTSVFLHMLSPMSKGLFHRVIAMSCGILPRNLVSRQPLQKAKQLAPLFNCSNHRNDEMVECLRKLPADQINGKFAEMRGFASHPIVIFGPVIEKYQVSGEERFLTDDPVTLIKKKKFYHVPVVTGIVKDEFSSWAVEFVQNETQTKELNEKFNLLAPILFGGYDYKEPAEVQKITDSFRKFYLDDGPITNNSVDGLGKLFSDGAIIYGEYSTAKLLSVYNEAPTFFYMLSYLGRYGHAKDPITQKATGPSHLDDLIYLFYVSKGFPKFNESDPEAFMVKHLTTFWSNFAANGNPTPSDSSVQWMPMTADKLRYYNFDSNVAMVNGLPYPDRMQLWESLFPENKP